MIEVRGFEFDPTTMSEDRALRLINTELKEAREDGAPITTITTAWEFYHWISEGWFEMLDTRCVYIISLYTHILLTEADNIGLAITQIFAQQLIEVDV